MDLTKANFDSQEFPSYRIGTQVHEHEARIRLLERDSADVKKTLDEMNKTIENFAREIESKLHRIESHIHEDLALHEKEEMQNQAKIMKYLISILISIVLSVLGSGLYMMFSQVMKVT